ncbi:uncharacterized protein PV09_03902 [Verruconis gallopava]|uniref:BZIP domain-containing protein n=1 Tax=Verruconis gallopava TaxID=253628 RepID=A0A0D1YXF7_9PEZI|nr:uncharacterized protein PV09_03902 [Verruconis gallopava]KIW05387.1 hypothetical protein PV09_03902 [Verruconis gallopava]
MESSEELPKKFSTIQAPCWKPICRTEDDWRGVTNPVERKKRQNRINQRTFRRKKSAQKKEQRNKQATRPEEIDNPDGASLLTCPQRIARVREAIKAAYQAYMLNVPGPTNLHMLIRLNVLQAIARNAVLMGFWTEGLCKDDYVSPYNDHGPRLPHETLPLANCPAALAPTRLQRTMIHHPWIDLFPFPDFRERVLRALDAGILDEDELCLDILEVDGRDLEERPALIVWGESSNPMAWEASVQFLRRWGWLVQGCPELLESTNYWRERRNERRLPQPLMMMLAPSATNVVIRPSPGTR